MNFWVISLLFCSVYFVSAEIECYQCISTVDDECDSSELDELAKYKKPCPELKEGTFAGQDPVGCRKIIQNVEDETGIVIRECAYSGEPVDGLKKSGNWAINKYFYQCENQEGEAPCNSTNGIFSAISVLIFALVALFH